MTQSNGVKSLDLATAQLPAVQAAEAKLLLQTYERNPILFVAGEGVHLIDEQGNRYLDLLSGIGVNALGYGHPAIVNAIAEQSKKLLHISNLFFHTGQAELAATAHRDDRDGPRLLFEQRYRGLGGSAQAGAALRWNAPQQGHAHRHKVPRTRPQLSRPDNGLGRNHGEGEVPRALHAGHAGRRVCPLQRRRRLARGLLG